MISSSNIKRGFKTTEITAIKQEIVLVIDLVAQEILWQCFKYCRGQISAVYSGLGRKEVVLLIVYVIEISRNLV